jgi:hypothetical protein
MPKVRLVRLPPGVAHPLLVRRFPTRSTFRDRAGERYGGSKVLGYAGAFPRLSAWLCQCHCGRKFIASSNWLNNKFSGCGKARHPLTGTYVYSVWRRLQGPRTGVKLCHFPFSFISSRAPPATSSAFSIRSILAISPRLQRAARLDVGAG